MVSDEYGAKSFLFHKAINENFNAFGFELSATDIETVKSLSKDCRLICHG
jgi:hypothetical protein